MGIMTEKLRDALKWLAQSVGLQKSRLAELQELKERLDGKRAENADQLEDLKEDIARLERKALRQKEERENVSGQRKKVIAGEIERTFRDLDRLENRENIIASNLEKTSSTIAKVEELIAAQQRGVQEETIDEIAVDLQDAIADMRASDEAVEQMERDTEYEGMKREKVDIETRMAQTEGEEETAEPELSEEAQSRLKELEMAEEE